MGEDGGVTPAHVVAVSRDDAHRFSKVPVEAITLVEGHGIEGDVHAGAMMKHRYGPHRGRTLPNLRQVHLLQSELFDEAREHGFELGPGDLGENVLTAGVDLLTLPEGTLVDLGSPVVRLTGLRNPCVQISRFRKGLMRVVLEKRDGATIRKVGVMSVVERGGVVRPGAPLAVTLPDAPHVPLVPL